MNMKSLQSLQPQLFATFHEILKREKLAHAYLFTGNFAASSMALLLAQFLFCEMPENYLPCGTCRACRLIVADDFSDVTQVRPQGNLIKTETVRELVREFSQSGFEGNRQVFIIHEADKMHVNAANSLLKVIEEPQSEIYIFLLSASEDRILPTIKSRTQIFHFPKNTDFLIREFELAGLVKSQAKLLADLAESPSDVAEMSQNRRLLDLVSTCEKLRAALLTDLEQAYLLVNLVVRQAGDKAEQAQVFQLLTSLLGEAITRPVARQYLEKLLVAKQMWQANVSLQNSLEYLVLDR